MTEIIQEGDQILRNKASEVKSDEISSERVKSIISNMKVTLSKCEEGVAIAAPQIGESLRIFVVSSRAFSESKSAKDLVFINPSIEQELGEKSWLEEGCLSVSGKYGEVERYGKAKIKALNEEGEQFKMDGEGLLAQIFQHELDHLDGVLFIDKARELKEMSVEERLASRAKMYESR